MKQFYTYSYTDPKSNVVRYVGKGSGKRCYSHFITTSNSQLTRMLKKRMKEGYKIEPVIHVEPDEATAFANEKICISLYGRLDLGTGTLFNHTDGGEGASGPFTKKHKENISIAKKAYVVTEEHKINIKKANRNRCLGKKTNEKSIIKRQATRLKKYGTVNVVREYKPRTHESIEKAQATMLKKYGKLSCGGAHKGARKGIPKTEAHKLAIKKSWETRSRLCLFGRSK